MLSSRPRALLLLFAFALIGGCRHDSGVPSVDPALYLRVGSDLAEEAPRAEQALRRGGYVVDARVEGRTFVAFAAHRPGDGYTHVRVASASGVDLALTAPEDSRPDLEEVGLASEAGEPSYDLDGDGYEEVLVRVVEASRPAPCIGVVRVGERGQLQEVPLSTLQLHPRACVESVGPSVSGGARRLWVTVRYDELGFEDGAPSVRVPLLPRDGGFFPPGPDEARADFEAQSEVRRQALARARDVGDGRHAIRLAVELAALARFAGAPPTAQLATFDAALEELGLDEEERARRARARELIHGGWGETGEPGAAAPEGPERRGAREERSPDAHVAPAP